jgi:hypothetical protein
MLRAPANPKGTPERHHRYPERRRYGLFEHTPEPPEGNRHVCI